MISDYWYGRDLEGRVVVVPGFWLEESRKTTEKSQAG
jgi:hypothetical protein